MHDTEDNSPSCYECGSSINLIKCCNYDAICHHYSCKDHSYHNECNDCYYQFDANDDDDD